MLKEGLGMFILAAPRENVIYHHVAFLGVPKVNPVSTAALPNLSRSRSMAASAAARRAACGSMRSGGSARAGSQRSVTDADQAEFRAIGFLVQQVQPGAEDAVGELRRVL